ncbi:MAG: hypothetical protein J6V14_01430, partial [Clostridia bacterium]|nr:hypothetical protein [Clostridia bacterium]
LRDCLSGEKIAEEDLKLRGPGDFFGESQHGLPAFHAANLYSDKDLLAAADNAARQILVEQGDRPESQHPGYREYAEYVRKKMPEAAIL